MLMKGAFYMQSCKLNKWKLNVNLLREASDQMSNDVFRNYIKDEDVISSDSSDKVITNDKTDTIFF